MVNVNQDPHVEGRHYSVFDSINRVTGLFAKLTDARAAIDDLRRFGFGDDQVEVFVGEKGMKRIDLEGEYHGPRLRTLRKWERIAADEKEINDRYEAGLERGDALVAVLTDGGEEQRRKAIDSMKAHAAEQLYFWGLWTIDREA